MDEKKEAKTECYGPTSTERTSQAAEGLDVGWELRGSSSFFL